MFSNRIAALLGAVFTSAVLACNSDRAYAPPDTVLTDQQVSRDVAVSEGEATAADLSALERSAGITRITASLVPDNPPASNCSYSATEWTCAPVIERGLTVVRSYSYRDSSGQAMQAFDELKTASANFKVSINGIVSRDTSFSGVVHRTQNITVSGLLGDETTRRWRGVGSSADTNTHRDFTSTRRYAGKSIDSLKAVVFPQPRMPGSYPLRGSTVRVVSYNVTSTGKNAERRSVDRRVVTTYNGTAEARIESGSVVCTLHLDTHRVDGCSG
jgi:hypothetical protein